MEPIIKVDIDHYNSEEEELLNATIEDPINSDITKCIMKVFFNILERSPELWDPENKFYTSKSKRGEAYGKLLRILKRLKPNATIDDVRKKLNSLKSNFNKELRKIELYEKNNKDFSPSWSFQNLQFLRNIRKQGGNNDIEKANTQIQLQSDFEMREGIESSLPSSSEDEKISIWLPENAQKIADSSKRKLSLPQSNKIKILKTNIPAEANILEKEPQQFTLDYTEIDPLVLVWSRKLKGLDPRRRLLAEKSINDILFQVQIKQFKRRRNNED